ncbi:MAG: acetate uptake transporter [Proteobacteria bacterium]|nr:acetate uptake transporter [Pseudomonadota bacterium]
MADATPQGNPAVVGLAGFGITTILLQFHNMGWGGTGTVFCAAMMIGGLMQMIAGFQEFKCGNNFGYSAFCSYGAFWLALGTIWLLADAVPAEWHHLKITGHDIGLFLLGYTIYTAIMWIASMRIHTAMALTFTTLLLGFIGLDLVFLAGMKEQLLTITTIDLFVCAGLALYMMAAAIYAQVFGRPILPVGKPWLS